MSDSHVMHCDIFSSLLDAAGLTVPESNGKNPFEGYLFYPTYFQMEKRQFQSGP